MGLIKDGVSGEDTVCHSERSEESRVLNGQIMFLTLLHNRITYQGELKVGILPHPKARSE